MTNMATFSDVGTDSESPCRPNASSKAFKSDIWFGRCLNNFKLAVMVVILDISEPIDLGNSEILC